MNVWPKPLEWHRALMQRLAWRDAWHDDCEFIDGRIYSKPRDKRVERSERKRLEFYRLCERAFAPARYQRTEPSARRAEPFVREGGPIAWRYLTPRCTRMFQRRELTLKQAKACAEYVRLARLNWLLWSVGTNFPRGEKLSGSSAKHNPTAGASFPIHRLDPGKRSVLDAALLDEVSFKDLPGINGTTRISRHRSGRRFFFDAIDDFSMLLTS